VEEERPAPRKAEPDRNACRLVGEDPPAEFFLNREGDTLVGRSDPVTGITPDVDLTPLDAQRSTSRRHAKLYQMSDTYYVMEEIGVMNGTYVNGNRVATGVPIAVQNGDVLKFGLVSLTFHSPEAA
jgi:pSer/pThr/pTyr-binding forkhead associated (FHA) protein